MSLKRILNALASAPLLPRRKNACRHAQRFAAQFAIRIEDAPPDPVSASKGQPPEPGILVLALLDPAEDLAALHIGAQAVFRNRKPASNNRCIEDKLRFSEAPANGQNGCLFVIHVSIHQPGSDTNIDPFASMRQRGGSIKSTAWYVVVGSSAKTRIAALKERACRSRKRQLCFVAVFELTQIHRCNCSYSWVTASLHFDSTASASNASCLPPGGRRRHIDSGAHEHRPRSPTRLFYLLGLVR